MVGQHMLKKVGLAQDSDLQNSNFYLEQFFLSSWITDMDDYELLWVIKDYMLP